MGIKNIKLYIYSAYIIVAGSNITAETVHHLEDYHVFGFNNQNELFQELVSYEDIESHGVTELRQISRYLINVDIPFDFGSSDGYVPYLGFGSNSVNIRGLEGNRIGIYIDGIPQPKGFIVNSWDQSVNSPGGSGRNYFDPNMYEGIDINKNTDSNSCPIGLSGSINFKKPNAKDTLDGNNQIYRNKLSLSSVNESLSNQQIFAKKDGDISYLAKISLNKGEETKNNGLIAANPTHFESQSAILSSHVPLNFGELLIDVEHYSSDTSSDLLSAQNKELSNVRAYIEEARERNLISSHLLLDKDPSTEVRLGVYHQSSSSDLFSNQQGGNIFGLIRDRDRTIINKIDTSGANISRTTIKNSPNLSKLARWGINYEFEKNSNKTIVIDREPALSISNKIGFCPSNLRIKRLYSDYTFALGEYKKYRLNLYADVSNYSVVTNPNAAYNERLSMISTTYDIPIPEIRNYDKNSYSTMIKVEREFKNGILLSGKVSKSNRNPSPEELSLIFTHFEDFVLIPNPNLRSEKSLSYEISLIKKHKDFNFSANLFYNKYNDFISNELILDREGGKDVLQPLNLGDVNIHGFEIGSNYIFPDEGNNKFIIGSSIGRSIGIDKTNNEWLESTDPFKFVLWLEHQNESKYKFKNRLTLSGFTRKSLISGDEFPEVKGFSVVDYSGSTNVNKNLKFVFGINNIFDRKYYKWSTIRRAVGHEGSVFTDRLTEPGRHFFISMINNF